MEDLWGFTPKQSNKPTPPPTPPKRLGGSSGTMSKKFGKTKEKAAQGMKKVKHGASDGFLDELFDDVMLLMTNVHVSVADPPINSDKIKPAVPVTQAIENG
ncbi:hypothetical protein POM88_032717 [Heracleum sosnowskyi]|uniref:Uncharacterized protein n=1 Tax=Heracleum sosnowskyi TaxID=360622 RepID=A0AAD8HZV4_9APIA|nr:hypothetical protein POM88_032717 [Heracleum sosnowskyi]